MGSWKVWKDEKLIIFVSLEVLEMFGGEAGGMRGNVWANILILISDCTDWFAAAPFNMLKNGAAA